ncbi:MAG: hypothetical protein V7731_00490 [Amphritea sp.]
MKRRSQVSDTKSLNTTATLGFIVQQGANSIIALKETGTPTLIDGLIRNGQGKEEAL